MENTAKIYPLIPPDSNPKTKTVKSESLLSELKLLNRKKLIKLRAKKISDGPYSLYLHLRHNDKQDYLFLKLYIHGKKNTFKQDKETLKLALSIRDKKELELFQNDYDFQLYNQNFKADFIEYFEGIVKTKIKKDGTIDKSWKHTLKHLKIFTKNKPVTFRQADETFCEKFKEYLTKTLSPNTAHTYFSKIKTAFNEAIKNKIILRSPAQFIKIKKQKTSREFLNENELKLLQDTPCKSKQTKHAFLFSCYTGLRISDLKKLTWKEIQDGYLVFRQYKTESPERMKLSVNAKRIIEQQKKQGVEDKVFNLISENKAIAHIKDWVSRAGIEKNISWHCGRHTFATWLLSNGIDIYTVSKLLGHEDVKVTQLYARLIDPKKDEAIDSLPII